MRSYVIKSILALTCLVIVSQPISGQKGKGGGGSTGGSACAVVATPSLSTVTISPGLNVGVFGRIGNCSSGRERYTVTISAVSSCGQETVIASSLITFNGGETKGISAAYAVAPDTCVGTSTVCISVYSGSTPLGTQSTPLTIQ